MTSGTVTKSKKNVVCKLHWKRIHKAIDLFSLTEVFSGLEYPAVLGANSSKTADNRFSYWACEPVEIFEFNAKQKRPFEKLQEALDRYKVDGDFGGDLPKGIFKGGWIGYFGYELGRFIEKLPEQSVDDMGMSLIRLCFYDKVISVDHLKGDCLLMVLELDEDTEGVEEKMDKLEELLEKSKEISVKKPAYIDIENLDFSNIKCNMNKEYYCKAIEEIRENIYDGNVYQVNFSQRFEHRYEAEPIKLFHWENYYNPSGYSAYIGGADFQIVSASPEMFITINDGVISTKPIKGTRARLSLREQGNCDSEQINKRNHDELWQSEKERAELNMIIDLERNDLGRICEYGTIKVVQPRTIESYPTVFHAVATVEGRIREGISFCDILKAMFPGGSITGAPKISSMEIIERLEPTTRGVYTGAIGFIGVDGNVCLNIAIRTIIIKSGKAFAQTGGGIVADSNAEAEWEETITKARALLAGIKAVQATD